MALSGQTVISDLDKTLKQLFQSEFGTTLPFDLSFAIPDKNFTPVSKTQTTLDCYLYEINEDRELRSVAPIVQRNIDGTIDKTLPPPRIKLSYCITAWSPAQPTPDGEPQLDEHTLLSQVLEVLFLTYQAPSTGPMVTTMVTSFGSEGPFYTIGGTVRDSNKPPNALASAWVRVNESGQTYVTDEEGQFLISQIAAGNYTLTVRVVGFKESGRSIQVPQPDGLYDVSLTPL